MASFVFQLIFWAIGLPLTLLVIATMVRGPYRQFPVLLLYIITGFLLTVAGMPYYIAYYFYREPGAMRGMVDWNFWNDLLLEPLAFAVVISLIYMAASHVRSRRLVLLGTIGGAILIASVSFLIHFNPSVTKGIWMALWTRDLNFFSEILDLGLWGLLLSARTKDPGLLLVTGGLGIQFTGETIGDSLRSIAAQRRAHSLPYAHPISYVGSFVSTVADLTALYVFWQAFRRSKNGDSAKAAKAR